jgi:hypothetical protein
MTDIKEIISAIDEFLEKKNLLTTKPVEINQYLDKKGVLKDSSLRPGKPIRALLRKGKIPHAYQTGSKWFIPHSKNSSINVKTAKTTASEKVITKTPSVKGHKLEAVGNLIVALLEKKHHKKPGCIYEYKPDWLLSYPSKKLVKKYPNLVELYAELTGHEYSLIEKMEALDDKRKTQKQSFDLWIGEPFNFAVEFDEEQHFNQFRKITLGYYKNIDIKFPLKFYKELNDNAVIKPGKSGFTKLKSQDPLFPFMLGGEKQDNRIRQRAFRDFLKDVLPLENNCNPTLRIPYHITNKRIKDFTEVDLKNMENYLLEHALLENLDTGKQGVTKK